MHELAKELHVTSKEILATLSAQGEFAKSASSQIEAPVARRLRELYARNQVRGPQSETTPPNPQPTAPKPPERKRPARKHLTKAQAGSVRASYRKLYATSTSPRAATGAFIEKSAAAYGVTRLAIHEVIRADKKQNAAAYTEMDKKRHAADYVALRNLSARLHAAKPDTSTTKASRAAHRVAAPALVPLAPRRRTGGLPPLSVALDVEACARILVNKNANQQAIADDLQAFDPAGDAYGYLAWRYASVYRRRYSLSVPPTTLTQVSSIAHAVDADRLALERLDDSYGATLGHPRLAQHVLDREFSELLDTEDDGRSVADEMRHIRDKEAFLYRSLPLFITAPGRGDQLWNMLESLQASLAAQQQVDNTPALTTATARLNSHVAALQALLAADEEALTGFCDRSRGELAGLHAGRYDYLRAFRDTVTASSAAHRDVHELSFTVLPQGEQLRNFLADLRRTGRYQGRQLDESRLSVLEDLEKHFGAERCRWHTGNRISHGIDNHYLVLAIASPNNGEHAVAISPHAGQHATYVVRHDPQQPPWETIFAGTKTQARQRSAHRLLFTAAADHGDEYVAMREKIIALLTAVNQPHS